MDEGAGADISREGVFRYNDFMGAELRGLAMVCVATCCMTHAGEPPLEDWIPREKVYYDGVLPDGSLTGGFVFLPRPTIDPLERIAAPVVTLWDPSAGLDGPPRVRLDLVIVGDGYQEPQLGLYAAHAQSMTDYLFTQQPFAAYRTFFRVHRVDVVSQDSGVSNDPTPGITRDTALQMRFWCNNIERFLCVNVTRAYQYANSAPHGVDQVLAIANSTKYGGAGYSSSNLATVSGGNSSAREVAVHEFGHSIGNLADEYHYGDGAVYSGGEPGARNASIYTAAEQLAQQRKWHRWIGVNDPLWDGLVTTYEGCMYHQYGIFRPTNNSKMRSLGRPFNLPSAEALIAEFYRIVRPIDASTPTSAILDGTEVVFVELVEPIGFPLSVQWFLDGQSLPGQTQWTIELPSLRLSPGFYTLRVEVVDNTPWVRDPAIRSTLLTQNRTWAVLVTAQPCYPDCDQSTGVRVLDIFDFLCFGNRFAAGDPYACDCDTSTGSNVCDIFDFLCFGNAFSAGCP